MSMSTEACLQGSLVTQRIYSLVLCRLLTMLLWLWSAEARWVLTEVTTECTFSILGFRHATSVYINLSKLQRRTLTIRVGYKMPYILVETRKRFDRMHCLHFEGRTGYLVWRIPSLAKNSWSFFFQNFGKSLPDYTTSYCRKRRYSILISSES
jgi:hypothetical protein